VKVSGYHEPRDNWKTDSVYAVETCVMEINKGDKHSHHSLQTSSEMTTITFIQYNKQ
jgi:hypothetical protein